MDCLVSLEWYLALFMCTSAYPFVVVCLSASMTQFAICWTLFLTLSLCCLFPFLPDFCLSLITESKSFVSLMFSNTAVFDLYASNLWTQTKMCSLFTSLIPFSTNESLIILTMMASSFMPLMNCSFSLLSFSLYLHSAAFTCNLSIHSCMDSLLLLPSLQYWNDNIVLLYCGLNFSLSILNSPPAVLHTTFSNFVKACMNCSPSLPILFSMIGTFSAPFSSYGLVCCIFITFISKFNSIIYLLGAFQSNAGCLNVGLSCLSLWSSPMLAILVPVEGSKSACFSVITATLAAWISTCMIVVCSESNYAISACILYISLLICLLSVFFTPDIM